MKKSRMLSPKDLKHFARCLREIKLGAEAAVRDYAGREEARKIVIAMLQRVSKLQFSSIEAEGESVRFLRSWGPTFADAVRSNNPEIAENCTRMADAEIAALVRAVDQP
jgi:hypothetical protein